MREDLSKRLDQRHRDLLRDFGGGFERHQRRMADARRAMLIWMVVVWIAFLGVIGGAVYFALTTSPEEVGAFFGRVAGAFRSPA